MKGQTLKIVRFFSFEFGKGWAKILYKRSFLAVQCERRKQIALFHSTMHIRHMLAFMDYAPDMVRIYCTVSYSCVTVVQSGRKVYCSVRIRI